MFVVVASPLASSRKSDFRIGLDEAIPLALFGHIVGPGVKSGVHRRVGHGSVDGDRLRWQEDSTELSIHVEGE